MVSKLIKCPYCGSKLYLTTEKKDYCSNCGLIEDVEEEDEKKERSYIG